MNYEKSIGPIYHEVSHVINRIMNASSEEKFNQYTNDLITIGKGKPKLIQLVNDMKKNMVSYVGYIIDHTPGSCCQRGSTRSEQNHSSVLAFIGKEFTGELDEILIHLLNRQCNLIKGFNKLISSQASQMRITIDKLHQSKKHPILLDAAKYLNQEAYNKFHKSYIDRIYYHLSIELDGSINISRDDLIERPRKFGDRHY